MIKFLGSWRLIAATVLVIPALLLLTPSARADIFDVQQDTVTGCSGMGSAGGGFCNSGTPYSLSALVGPASGHGSGGSGGIGYAYLESLAPGAGTIDFWVTDDLGTNSGFSFTFTDGKADNAHCSLNGNSGDFGDCSIVQSVNDSHGLNSVSCNTAGCTSPQLDHYFDPAATISFSGNNLLGTNFELEFVSMQGLAGAPIAPTPEPSSLALFATGLFGLVGFVRRRLIS
jgi:hypothetical protein